MRVRGIKPVTVRKGGKTYRYFYHRATGKKIASAPDTAAFAAEVAALDERAKEPKPRDGSLHALIVAYRDPKNPDWANLKPVTQSDYQRVFDWLHPIRDMALIEIDGPFIYALRDKAFHQHKRRFANYVVQVIRLLLAWGKRRGFVSENAAGGVEKIKRPKGMAKANRAWEDYERDVVLAEADIELRAVIALGMFVGLREGDACSFPRTAYDGKVVEAVASKNGEPLWVPVHYRLREILTEAFEARRAAAGRRAKRRKIVPLDPPTLVVSSRGTPWTVSGFRASFFKLVKRLAAEGKVKPKLTFHGLRHTVGKLAIEAGLTRTDVGKLLGDRSEAMSSLYSQEHEKRHRMTAIITKLEKVERKRLGRRGKNTA